MCGTVAIYCIIDTAAAFDSINSVGFLLIIGAGPKMCITMIIIIIFVSLLLLYNWHRRAPEDDEEMIAKEKGNSSLGRTPTPCDNEIMSCEGREGADNN